MCKVVLAFACLVGAQLNSGYSIDSSQESQSALEDRQGCDQRTSTSPKALAALLLRHVRIPKPFKLRQRRTAPKLFSGDWEWEVDFYSRPVQGADGKKLWELLVTDSQSSFRHVEPVPAGLVNSRELRERIQRLIEDCEEPPKRIKFFRSQMKNMINIALRELKVDVQPSRTTYALYDWLEERERDVYPNMPGYKPARNQNMPVTSMPDKLPDAYRGESFQFVQLRLAEFLPGGGFNEYNIGSGNLCPIPPELKNLSPETMVPGMTMISERAENIAYYMRSLDLAAVDLNMGDRTINLAVGLDKTYLMGGMNPTVAEEAQRYISASQQVGGLHFFSIMKPNEDMPAGFWLMRGT